MGFGNNKELKKKLLAFMVAPILSLQAVAADTVLSVSDSSSVPMEQLLTLFILSGGIGPYAGKTAMLESEAVKPSFGVNPDTLPDAIPEYFRLQADSDFLEQIMPHLDQLGRDLFLAGGPAIAGMMIEHLTSSESLGDNSERLVDGVGDALTSANLQEFLWQFVKSNLSLWAGPVSFAAINLLLLRQAGNDVVNAFSELSGKHSVWMTSSFLSRYLELSIEFPGRIHFEFREQWNQSLDLLVPELRPVMALHQAAVAMGVRKLTLFTGSRADGELVANLKLYSARQFFPVFGLTGQFGHSDTHIWLEELLRKRQLANHEDLGGHLLNMKLKPDVFGINERLVVNPLCDAMLGYIRKHLEALQALPDWSPLLLEYATVVKEANHRIHSSEPDPDFYFDFERDYDHSLLVGSVGRMPPSEPTHSRLFMSVSGDFIVDLFETGYESYFWSPGLNVSEQDLRLLDRHRYDNSWGWALPLGGLSNAGNALLRRYAINTLIRGMHRAAKTALKSRERSRLSSAGIDDRDVEGFIRKVEALDDLEQTVLKAAAGEPDYDGDDSGSSDSDTGSGFQDARAERRHKIRKTAGERNRNRSNRALPEGDIPVRKHADNDPSKSATSGSGRSTRKAYTQESFSATSRSSGNPGTGGGTGGSGGTGGGGPGKDRDRDTDLGTGGVTTEETYSDSEQSDVSTTSHRGRGFSSRSTRTQDERERLGRQSRRKKVDGKTTSHGYGMTKGVSLSQLEYQRQVLEVSPRKTFKEAEQEFITRDARHREELSRSRQGLSDLKDGVANQLSRQLGKVHMTATAATRISRSIRTRETDNSWKADPFARQRPTSSMSYTCHDDDDDRESIASGSSIVSLPARLTGHQESTSKHIDQRLLEVETRVEGLAQVSQHHVEKIARLEQDILQINVEQSLDTLSQSLVTEPSGEVFTTDVPDSEMLEKQRLLAEAKQKVQRSNTFLKRTFKPGELKRSREKLSVLVQDVGKLQLERKIEARVSQTVQTESRKAVSEQLAPAIGQLQQGIIQFSDSIAGSVSGSQFGGSISQLDELSDAEGGNHQPVSAGLTSYIADLGGDQAPMAEKLGRQEEIIHDLDVRLEKVKESLPGHDKRLTRLENSQGELRTDLDTTREDVAGHDQQLASLESRQKELADLETWYSRLNEVQVQAQDEVASHTKTLTEHQASVKKSLMGHGQQLASLKKETSSLRSNQLKQSEQLDTLQREQAGAGGLITEHRGRIDKHGAELEQQNKKQKELDRGLASVRPAVATQGEELAELRERLQQMEERLASRQFVDSLLASEAVEAERIKQIVTAELGRHNRETEAWLTSQLDSQNNKLSQLNDRQENTFMMVTEMKTWSDKSLADLTDRVGALKHQKLDNEEFRIWQTQKDAWLKEFKQSSDFSAHFQSKSHQALKDRFETLVEKFVESKQLQAQKNQDLQQLQEQLSQLTLKLDELNLHSQYHVTRNEALGIAVAGSVTGAVVSFSIGYYFAGEVVKLATWMIEASGRGCYVIEQPAAY